MTMTLKELSIYFNAFEKRRKHDNYYSDVRTARVCCLLANINRDTKKKRIPYTEKDFMPGQEKEVMSAEKMAMILKAITLSMGGEINV